MRAKFSFLYFFMLFLLQSTASAEERPCLKDVWKIIEINLSENHGCANENFPEYKALCSEFRSCVEKYDICVISGGVIYKGNTEDSIHLPSPAITFTFGINQQSAIKNHKYCTWGGLSESENEGPFWTFRTSPILGTWEGSYLEDLPQYPLSLAEFIKLSNKNFNLFISNARENLRTEPFSYERYGYKKGEEP